MNNPVGIELFGPECGGPCKNYRIPSLIVTKKGTVIACCDARYYTGADNPNRIDKVIRRSFDSGETWEDVRLIVQEQGTSRLAASAAIDPSMVYIEKTNRILLFYAHTPAGIGILNCRVNKGYDDDGNLIVKNGFKKYKIIHDKLFTLKDKPTPYTVDKTGNVFENGALQGNIYIGKKFMQAKTFFLMCTYSDDEGETWSEPKCLNPEVKEDYMSFLCAGPGCGIVIQNGKYAGRVVLPIYFGTTKFPPLRLSCACIFSDDNGLTWSMGKSPNEARGYNVRRVYEQRMLTEAQVIEQENGRLKIFMRNHDKRKRVAVAYSSDGAENWDGFRFDDSLRQCICQLSVIKLQNTEKPTVVFINADSEKERANGTIRISEDDGETWKYSRVFRDGPFAYSALAQLPDGNIGVFYEPDLECKSIRFWKVSLDWIKGKE